ncbi:MAG TPA: DUF3617 family protein [Anaeromyxobacteraceae bacterium]
MRLYPLPKPWLASLGLLAWAAAQAQAPEPGVLWEQTVEMDMGGFAMPPRTSRFCAPKRWTRPPPSQGQDDRCKLSDVKVVGDRMTWKVECAPPDAMTGSGDIRHAGDAFQGLITMRSADGEVRMKMRGKMLGGACDAGEQRRAAETARRDVEAMNRDAQARAAQAYAQACDASIKSMNPLAFEGQPPLCPQARKAEFCAQLATRQGYEQARPQAAKIGALCGRDPEAYLPELCARSRKDLESGSGGREAGDFLVRKCPAEAKAASQRLCAGRSYTGVDARYRDFCSRQGSGMQEGEGASAASPAQAEDRARKKAESEAAEKGKSMLKGLFGK